MQKNVWCLLLSLPLLISFCPLTKSYAAEQGLSVGYGFAALNEHISTGRIEGGRNYDFFQFAYLYEMPFWSKVSIAAEPFAASVNRPDAGLDVLARWYPCNVGASRLFVDLGAGAAYTSIKFQEQGTHLLGVLAVGIGLRYHKFFIEDRVRHYSNGGTAYPNRAVDANIISVGMYF
jgi:pantothenate kinase type III